MTEQQGQAPPTQSQQTQQNQQQPQQQQQAATTQPQPPPVVSNPPVVTQTQAVQSQPQQQQPVTQNIQQQTAQLQQQQQQALQQAQQVQQVQQVAQQHVQQQQQQQPVQQQQQTIQQQPQQLQQSQPAQQQVQNVQVQQGQLQSTSCATPTIVQAGNQLTQAATGIRTPGIPQVQVIPQIHSPSFMTQFPYNQQQQIMLQNAMQAAMNMNMNMTQQQQLNMSMAMAMQGRTPSVGGNLNSPGLMSPSPTTPTQGNLNFASSQVQTLVSNSLAQNSSAKGNNNKVQTTATQQATALVAGKPIMPTQAMQAGATPIVLGVLPNQVASSQGFVTSKGQTISVAMTNNGQQMLTTQAAALRFSQPQVVSSTGQIISSQPFYTNQAMLQAMAANLQQQGAIPLATHQPLLSGTGQSQAILAGQSLYIRAANPLQPQQGIITGIQNLGAQIRDGKAENVQGLQGKTSIAGVQIGKQVQVAGSQIGKTMITPLNKTATARINPTVTQRPRISIPNLPKNQNRGRPRSQSKGAPVSMASASTNTVASALSQARTGALSQSKPATPTNQMNSTMLKSQSDSEVETSKKNATTELSKKLLEEKNKNNVPDSIEKSSNGEVVIEKQKAIVKPHILTHVIEGFVIQEGPEPFPVQRSSLLTEFIPPKPGQVPMETDNGTPGMSVSPVQSPVKVTHKVEPPAVFEKCEFCGTEEQMAKFSKRSKRFCSMGCAKRYNVAHRISMFKPRGRGGGRPPLAGRFMRKRGKPLNIRKGWRPGRGGRLSYNTSSKFPGEIDSKENNFDHEEMSNSSLSDSSSTPDSPPPPPPTLHAQGDTDMELEIPKAHPSKWNVVDVCEFIKALPGCAPYAEEFRSQEIDGQALMLLKEDHLMTTMNMKLGPALKICAKINCLKDGHE